MTPNHDEATEKTLIELITPGTYSADTTPAAIALEGFEAATLLLHIGVGGITFTSSNKIEYVLTHSFDGTTYVNVTDADIIPDPAFPGSISNGIIRSLVAAHAAADVQKVGYIGGAGYLKLLAYFSGTHGTGTPFSAMLVKEDPFLMGAA